MRRRALLLLTTMALTLAVACGTAMAEEAQLDGEWATHDTVKEINQYGGYQTSRAGITGTISKVAVLVGCCGGTDAPAGDLHVTVYSGGISSTTIIPKATFTNDDVLRWIDVPLDTPIPVEGADRWSNVSIFLKNTAGTSPYLWALDTRSSGGTAGGYAGGAFVRCGPEFGGRVECDPTTFDANFRTYVIPGPDLVPPNTYLPYSEGGVTNGPIEGSTWPHSRASFVFRAYENGLPAGSGTTFECMLDEGGWEVCTSPKEYTGLSDGFHTFQVRARDAAGNVDPTPERRQWFVDDTSPTVGSVSPENRATNVAPGTNVEATFSEPMDPSTLDSFLTFTLREQDSDTTVLGTVRYDSATRKATFDPHGDLKANKTYTATILGGSEGWLVRDLAGNPLEQDYSWSFTTASIPAVPRSTHTLSPQPNAAGWNNSNVTVTLNATDTGGSGIKEIRYSATGAQSIAETVYDPQNPPVIDTEGTTTISYFATDNAENVETPAKTVTVRLDKMAPQVTPADVVNDVWRNSSLSEQFAAFDDESGLANSADASFTLTASAESASATQPTVASRTVLDVAGNSTTRTVSALIDKSAPILDTDISDGSDGVTPNNRETGVSRTIAPTATFSDPMNLASLTTSVKLYRWNALKKVWQRVPATVSLEGDTTARLDPYGATEGSAEQPLAANKKYKVTVSTGAKNLADIPMSSPKSWTFTTGGT
jgi:hypothetical protein